MGNNLKAGDRDYLKPLDIWFTRSLEALIGGEMLLVKNGIKSEVDRKMLLNWVAKHQTGEPTKEESSLQKENEELKTAIANKALTLTAEQIRIAELEEALRDANKYIKHLCNSSNFMQFGDKSVHATENSKAKEIIGSSETINIGGASYFKKAELSGLPIEIIAFDINTERHLIIRNSFNEEVRIELDNDKLKLTEAE